MEQDKAKLLLKADAYIAFLVEQGKVFTYLPQGQTGIFGTVYQPRPAELYPGLQGGNGLLPSLQDPTSSRGSDHLDRPTGLP